MADLELNVQHAIDQVRPALSSNRVLLVAMFAAWALAVALAPWSRWLLEVDGSAASIQQSTAQANASIHAVEVSALESLDMNVERIKQEIVIRAWLTFETFGRRMIIFN